MAITQDYCDFATGNDYKGASFVDGAWTAATHTLTKAGAFAATKVNHWLYLEPNGGASFTAGYYRVATVPDANSVTLASDPAVGNLTDVKCTQHDGTTTLPWRSLQGAFDLLTRNSSDGNQVNLKAGTAQVNAAALDLTTFIAGGALAAASPLIIRGYTASANDGGVGEIDCGGAPMFAATTYDYVMLIDLEMHTFGDNNGIVLDQQCLIYRCELHKGASSPSSRTLATLAGSGAIVGCYVHDSGAGIDVCIALPQSGVAIGNYILPTSYRGISCGSNAVISGNIFKGSTTSFQAIIYDGTGPATVIGNVAYNSAAGTQMCLYLGNAAGRYAMMCINNIIVGQRGAGGKGIGTVNTGAGMVGSNAFYNNTANYGFADVVFVDETSNDVTLAADPFTDAANGDFSLTAAAKAALAGAGWPTSYLGADAATVPNLNIGPIQLAAAAASGGGFPKIASLLGRTRM